MGVCSPKYSHDNSDMQNYQPGEIKSFKSNANYVSISANESKSLQDSKENENNQMKWIEQIICQYKEGDQTPNFLKINKVADSHHAKSFTAIGRVISVFNDDIVYNQKSFYYGTGSIINQRIVLTAAHVLKHGVLNVLADYVYFQLQSASENLKKYIQVKRYGFHRNFIQFDKNGKDKQSQKHDIAVLILQDNNLITPQITLGVQLNYNFTKQVHFEALVAGYPHHLNIGTQPFKQFWAQIRPSGALHNFLLYENLLGGGFSGSPLMIQTQNNKKTRLMVFAVHKGQIGSKGYSVCLNNKTNKLNQLLEYFSIKDATNQSDFMQSTLKVKDFENTITLKENKLIYRNEVLFLDDIRWSRQISNKLQLNQFLQKLQEADSFKKGIQQMKYNIYSLFKQVEQQNRCLFRYHQWKYFFQLFKNLYLNDEQQEKILNILLRMVNLNFRFNPKINNVKQCKQIGQMLHYFWNSVHFKTRTWCKLQGQNTQNNLKQITQRIRIEINNAIEKGYHEFDFKQRKIRKNEYLLWFYYCNNNLERADKLQHTINRVQQQETPNILHINGLIMLKTNNLQKAKIYLTQYLKFLQKNGVDKNISRQAQVLMQIGKINNNQSKYEDALVFYKRSLQIYQKVNTIQRAYLLNEMGLTYYNQKKYDDALAFYQRSLQIYQSFEDTYSIECVSTLNKMGQIYRIQGNYDDAHTFHKKQFQIYEKVKDMKTMYTIDFASTLNCMGTVYTNHGMYKEALVFYWRSLQIYERMQGKDTIDSACILNNMGTVYTNQHKYEDALVFYKKSLQIYKRVNGQDTIECATILKKLGQMYRNQNFVKNRNKFDDALVFYKRSLQIYERMQEKHMIECMKLLKLIGLCYVMQCKYQDALVFYKRILQTYERVEGQDMNECADTLKKIGSIYSQQEQFDDSLAYYRRSLQIYEQVKGKYSIECADILKIIGSIYSHKKNYEDSLAFYKRSLQMYEKSKGKDTRDYIITLRQIVKTQQKQKSYFT